MSEAEKKWDQYDQTFYDSVMPNLASNASRQAYKYALRREIEKRKKTFLDEIVGKDRDDAFEAAIFELDHFLELLDTVEP